MAFPQSSLIIEKFDGAGGNFIDSPYLGAAYDADKPHVFQDTLMKVYASKSRFFTSKPLMAMAGFGKEGKMEIESETYQWYLQDAEHEAGIITEFLEEGNPAIGLNNTPFRIKLHHGYYHEPDVLMLSDNEYQVEIIGSPEATSTGAIYTVRLQGDNPAVVVPAYLLQPGQEVCKAWTTVQSELTRLAA